MTSSRWDHEADLVVVGYGGAGAAAAITAADRGASVLIVEKQPTQAHTPSTRLSGGRVMGVNDVDQAERYLDLCAGGMVPRDVSRAWAEKALNLRSWLAGLDVDLNVIGGPEQLGIEGAAAIEVYGQGFRKEGDPGFVLGEADQTRKSGPELFAKLGTAVTRRESIEVLWESPAERLLRDNEDRISGVEIATSRGRQRIRARRGVVLTCGGYGNDQELKRNYLRAPEIHFYSNPGNTGEGVRMAQAVGADLWHMNQMIGRAMGHFPLGDGKWMNFLINVAPPGYVFTDKYGRRFADEYPQTQASHGFYHHLVGFDADAHDYPRIPSYWFFDQRRLNAGPLVSTVAGAIVVGLATWSFDNQDEIARGWIKTGQTVEEVAESAGVMDPEAAARTVADYNEACEKGHDPFGRPAESLVPLDQPPFYCVTMYPGGSNTTGGPRRNARAEILDPFGEPIAGLYGAGELGQATGALCPSFGCNLSDCFSFGQIAAASALE